MLQVLFSVSDSREYSGVLGIKGRSSGIKNRFLEETKEDVRIGTARGLAADPS